MVVRTEYVKNSHISPIAKKQGNQAQLDIKKRTILTAIEIEVPERMIGNSLSSLDFSRKYGLTVSFKIRDGEPILTHFVEIPFQNGDYFYIIGENTNINKFKKKFL
ncbi:TrkA C-terminal domain-containing protein [Neobacillus vireti]|uniref:TrkA C-terminal domain-containing protein n=1 Tax=Neobacillus vireti TaxID=220686 RepID=UPI003B58B232